MHGEALFHAIATPDFEVIVAKRVNAPYKTGRHADRLAARSGDRFRALGIVGNRHLQYPGGRVPANHEATLRVLHWSGMRTVTGVM